MDIKYYEKPSSMEQAYRMLLSPGSRAIGGGAFMQISGASMETGVDLSNLGLDFIQEKDDSIEIGSMTTLWEIQQNGILNKYYDGCLLRCIRQIMGIQIRNIATIGGTVWGRYGFSDLLTALLVLDASVVLYHGGSMSLEEFLDEKPDRDILMKIVIKKHECRASFLSEKNSAGDFSVLNAAVSKIDGRFKIAVGARPGRACLVHKAMAFMDSAGEDVRCASLTGELAGSEINFGGDIRGSSDYRKELCRVLVKRCILEVIE